MMLSALLSGTQTLPPGASEPTATGNDPLCNLPQYQIVLKFLELNSYTCTGLFGKVNSQAGSEFFLFINGLKTGFDL